MTFEPAETLRDPFVLYGESFASRLLLGTARYPSPATLQAAVEASRPAMITVALRRQSAVGKGDGSDGQTLGGQAFWQMLRALGVPVLPNTAGCFTAQEVITTAMMAREVFETDWIKLELIGDDYTLQPDTLNMPAVAETLIKEGFKVLPYCTEDLVLCRRLLDVGCQALMPWAAPIGTGRGAANPLAMRTLRDRLPDTPLIVDAGLGLPSHAAQVLEWGYDGVLLNTAVAQSAYPVNMARGFALAVEAGRTAYLAGPMPERDVAQASTPVVGMPFWHAEGAEDRA